MSNINNILSKIEKVNKIEDVKLASQRVELGSLDMIMSMHDNGIDIYKQGQTWAKEMETFIKKSRELNRMATALSNGLEKEINDFEKKAKELGLNTNNIPELNKAIQVLGLLDNVIKMTEKFK